MRSDASGCPFYRSRDAFTARPSAPMASRWRSQSIGTAIEMYWWMRAKVRGCTSDVAPLGADSGSRSSPAICGCAPSEHQPELLVVESRELRGSHRHSSEFGWRPYG